MKLIFILAFIVFSLSSPIIEDAKLTTETLPGASLSHPLLSSSLVKFSTKLYQLVEKNEGKQNIIIAPFSIHMAMSLLYNGAVGNSKKELEAALGFQGAKESDILQESKSLMSYYNSFVPDPSTQIELANVLFVGNGTVVKDDYIRILTENYFSGVETIDYSNHVESARIINNWISNKTNNLIEKFVNPGSISCDTSLMLMNAVYFKANWLNPFFKTQTKKSPFRVTLGLSVEVDMMFQENNFVYNYDKDLKSQVISLPYENEDLVMVIILPDEEITIESVTKQLRTQDFNKLQGKLSQENIYLKMPKFNINYKTSLVNAFGNLGVQAIFNDELANLSKIADELLVVSNIIHETTLKVTEEGSEAAAITGIELDTRSSGFSPVPVIVNRPFMFVIHDIKNNIPMFMGKVVNPTNQEPTINIDDKRKNLIEVRNSQVFNDLESLNLDPEERVYLQNKPEDYSRPKICKEVEEYSGTKPGQVIYPCNETPPITEYRFSINGEKAALAFEDEVVA